MTFEDEKRTYMDNLYKPDRSKKGNVDEQISYILDKINSLDDYYTTSSCAGRIVLIKIPRSGKKHEAEWLFTSHDEIKIEDLPLDNFPEETVWLRQESAIFHICCKDLESAQKLVDSSKFIGFKRSGIMATNKRIMVELTSTESMDVPIAKDHKLLVDLNYINYLVNQANQKLRRNREKIKKLFSKIN